MMRDLAQPLVESLFATSTPNDEHYMMDGFLRRAEPLRATRARARGEQNVRGRGRPQHLRRRGLLAWKTAASDLRAYAEGPSDPHARVVVRVLCLQQLAARRDARHADRAAARVALDRRQREPEAPFAVLSSLVLNAQPAESRRAATRW